MQVSSNAMSIYLALWSTHAKDMSPGDVKQFLLVLGVIVIVNMCSTGVRSYTFAKVWGILGVYVGVYGVLCVCI